MDRLFLSLPDKAFLLPIFSILRFLLLSSLLFSSSFVFATVSNSNALSTQHQCIEDHFSALLHLKQGFNFSARYSKTGLPSWNPDNRDCCSWEGITCNGATGHVTSLDLSELRIYGRIDFVSLFRLQSLQKLNLASNEFDPSPIPSGFEQLTSLTHLNLSSSNFYGHIPLEISRLTTLVSLDLSYNQYLNYLYFDTLKLEIPNMGAFVQNLSSLRELHLDWVNISAQGSEWGLALSSALPHLHKLSLRYCGLSGPIHPSLSKLHFLSELDLSGNNLSSVVPNFIGNFSSLTSLALGDCGLHGKIPESIFRLPNLQTLDEKLEKLVYLDLSNNGFSGPLPSSLGNLHNLVTLDLSYNDFGGPLPSSFGNLSNLVSLDLSYNGFSGPLPSSLANLNKLVHLDFSSNGFSGPIPSSLFSLPSLQELHLQVNQFSGELGEFQNTSSSLLEIIYLYENKLEGPIPRSIFQLTMLRELKLYSNNFNGTIPSLYGNALHNCTLLDFSNNSLSGTIPSLLLSLPSLESLYLQDNQFSGRLGQFHHPSSSLLSTINLENNKLNELIPKSIFELPMLEGLHLSSNNFSGEIPNWLWNDSLIVLNLGGNAFHGLLHQTFKEECTLETLDLNGNQLEGQVPSSLVKCKKLEVLNLGNNQIHDTFPFWIENLSQLHILILGSNKFHGTIGHPQANHTFPLLQIFDLSNNSFTGKLSSNMFRSWKAMMETKSQSQFLSKTFINGYYQDRVTIVSKGLEMELVKILTAFTVVDLSNNQFHGDIPESVGNLKSLVVLNASYNHFTGRIPVSLGNIKALESLDLSHNNVSGEIPWQLTKLNFLAVLDLSQNLLTGSIPQGQQFNTFMNKSFLGNLGLCGIPLSKKCEHVEAHASPPVAQLESKYDWRSIWIGFGVGYGVGMGILFWTLALWTNGMREFTIFIDKLLMLIFPCGAFILMHRY
ncbi:receptor-like protein 7 [Magnolia sinica]|uniref:receptor-like protein 7 n=1 Tax=Magnolia sinica TaxID=86752 RepID=UPI0026580D43|nr:receptor-like protein 7 [Magnolia sinica]